MVVAGGNPGQLLALGIDIGEIIATRSALVRSESKIVINEAEKPGRLLGAMQQIAMSAAAVGTEVSFYRPPQVRMQFDEVLSSHGADWRAEKDADHHQSAHSLEGEPDG